MRKSKVVSDALRQRIQRCSICGEIGHKKQTCTQAAPRPQVVYVTAKAPKRSRKPTITHLKRSVWTDRKLGTDIMPMRIESGQHVDLVYYRYLGETGVHCARACHFLEQFERRLAEVAA
jgi:hypothetical protein